ncbi:MAG: ribonucleotide monophosphatase NagD (HAD superfamily) [Bacillariaceae sp.]|jgi:ribonucleotide monophosphatase NagD (HAD superfamily)
MRNQFIFLPLAACYCYYIILGVQVVEGFRQQSSSSSSSSSLSQRIPKNNRRLIIPIQEQVISYSFITTTIRRKIKKSTMKTLTSTTLSMTTTTTATTDEKKEFQILGGYSDGSGICNIANDYDVFLLDMWGVMHDGIQPYNGVLEVIQKLKNYNNENEKKLIILSNSSKRRSNSVKMLHKLGFNENDFDEIITSGEVAHHLLQYLSSSELDEEESSSSSSLSSWIPKNIPSPFEDLRTTTSISRNNNNNNNNNKAFCFGSGDEDEIYLNSCGWTLAESIKDANLIVARGTFVIHQKHNENNENENDDVIKNNVDVVVDKKIDEKLYWKTYQDVLDKAARQQIPMIVCNPDKIRPDADEVS